MPSPKLNGVRCIIFGGVAYSRSLKLLPNLSVQQWAKENASDLEGLDGEIIVGSETAADALNQSTSGVMRKSGEPEFTFWVFDYVHRAGFQWEMRLFALKQKTVDTIPNTRLVEQMLIDDADTLRKYELDNLSKGYEGTMLKSPEGPYKFGRSSVKQGYLLKRKIFVDDEFEIVGYEPKYHNDNEAYTNELGRTTRSTSKENLVALDTLGALICKTKEGHTFNVGTGYDDKMRKELWEIRAILPGQLAKVKYFPEGMQDVPLLPVFLQIRSEIDL